MKEQKMKKLQKLWVLMLIVGVVFSLVGCKDYDGGKDPGTGGDTIKSFLTKNYRNF
jgi:uncharacterized lipoprotein YehR (DUF1307 family)